MRDEVETLREITESQKNWEWTVLPMSSAGGKFGDGASIVDELGKIFFEEEKIKICFHINRKSLVKSELLNSKVRRGKMVSTEFNRDHRNVVVAKTFRRSLGQGKSDIGLGNGGK